MRIYRILDKSNRAVWAEESRDETGQLYRLDGDPFAGLLSSEQPVEAQRILAPVIPPAIFCIGLNYRKHAEETGAEIPKYPVIFMKNPATLLNPGEPIQIPQVAKTAMVDYECELAIVIKRTCKNVSEENATDVIMGYTCANDVSSRDWQKHRGGGQWVRGKSFDTFCPLGPCIVTPDEITNPNGLNISTTVNGEILQQSNTADMIFTVPQLVAFLSQSTTLLAGSIILTGTPSGVGMARDPQRFLNAGDEVSIKIQDIGTLTNPVIDETP